MLGRHRRIVEEAEAPARVLHRMVAGRTAQSIDVVRLARAHPLGRLDGRLGRPVDGRGCAFHERTGRVGGIIAELADDALRHAPGAPVRVIVRHSGHGGAGGLHPFRPPGEQEVHIALVMHRLHRCDAVVARRFHLMAGGKQRIAHQDGALGLFGMGNEGAAAEIEFRVMQQLARIENELHHSPRALTARGELCHRAQGSCPPPWRAGAQVRPPPGPRRHRPRCGPGSPR